MIKDKGQRGNRGITSLSRNLSCEDELPWKEGSTLINYINGVEMDGLTGPIRYTTVKILNTFCFGTNLSIQIFNSKLLKNTQFASVQTLHFKMLI